MCKYYSFSLKKALTKLQTAMKGRSHNYNSKYIFKNLKKFVFVFSSNGCSIRNSAIFRNPVGLEIKFRNTFVLRFWVCETIIYLYFSMNSGAAEAEPFSNFQYFLLYYHSKIFKVEGFHSRPCYSNGCCFLWIRSTHVTSKCIGNRIKKDKENLEEREKTFLNLIK